MSRASEPVSWLVVERGWKVEASDGRDVGKVEETVGDSERDIFNGLTVARGLLGRPRYVPAENVAEISEGRVRLAISAEQFEHLDEYEEPPPSAQIRPG
jgi:Uncharacterized protein conserved in bacteria (DUF2171)